jgi:hypothetical protein
MDQGHNSNQGDVQGREEAVGQGIGTFFLFSLIFSKKKWVS